MESHSYFQGLPLNVYTAQRDRARQRAEWQRIQRIVVGSCLISLLIIAAGVAVSVGVGA